MIILRLFAYVKNKKNTVGQNCTIATFTRKA